MRRSAPSILSGGAAKKRARPVPQLHDAVLHCDVAGLEQLVSSGLPLTEVDSRGRTPLHLAVTGSELVQIQMLMILLSGGDEESRADAICTRGRDGRTPLHVAASCASSTTVDILLSAFARGFVLADAVEMRTHLKGGLYRGNWGKKGADGELEALDVEHMTPLHLALERLDTSDADDDADAQPLSDAARGEAVGMVRLLITRGADVNARDADGRTPIHQAVEAAQPEVAELLLNAGADYTMGCKAIGMANTTLHQAVLRGDEAMLRLLVRAAPHVDVNAAGQNGLSPLCLAARSNKVSCAKVLLEGGADPKAATAYGKTALDIARINQRVEILKLFGEEA